MDGAIWFNIGAPVVSGSSLDRLRANRALGENQRPMCSYQVLAFG